MATFAQIKEIRLTINDPALFTDILQVATSASLPASPAFQTVYNVADSGAYVSTDKTSGALPADYSTVEYNVSDTRISSWFDAYGESGAVIRGFSAIIQRLGAQMLLEESTDGAERTRYTKLSDMLAYYKRLQSDYLDQVETDSGDNTGRIGTSAAVTLSGGFI